MAYCLQRFVGRIHWIDLKNGKYWRTCISEHELKINIAKVFDHSRKFIRKEIWEHSDSTAAVDLFNVDLLKK